VNKYTPRKYDRPGFTNATALQEQLTRSMRFRDRRLAATFFSMIFVFIAGILVALFLWPPAALVVIGYTFVALIYFAINIIPQRLPVCPYCGRRMAVDWVESDGRDARFAVCEQCRLFLDTHWRSRF